MRNLILFFTLFFSSLWYVNAQGQVDICALNSSQIKYDGDMRDAIKLSMEIPMDEVKDAFNDFVKEQFDSDLKGYGFLARKDEVSTELMEAPLLADQAIQLIGSFKKIGATTDLYLLARWADESYVRESTDHHTYDRLKEVGNDFLQYYVPGYYQEQLDQANKNYADAVDAYEDLEKDLDKGKDDLEKLKQDLIDKEEEIESINAELKKQRTLREKKKEMLESQRKKVERAKKVFESGGLIDSQG